MFLCECSCFRCRPPTSGRRSTWAACFRRATKPSSSSAAPGLQTANVSYVLPGTVFGWALWNVHAFLVQRCMALFTVLCCGRLEVRFEEDRNESLFVRLSSRESEERVCPGCECEQPLLSRALSETSQSCPVIGLSASALSLRKRRLRMKFASGWNVLAQDDTSAFL